MRSGAEKISSLRDVTGRIDAIEREIAALDAGGRLPQLQQQLDAEIRALEAALKAIRGNGQRRGRRKRSLHGGTEQRSRTEGRRWCRPFRGRHMDREKAGIHKPSGSMRLVIPAFSRSMPREARPAATWCAIASNLTTPFASVAPFLRVKSVISVASVCRWASTTSRCRADTSICK